jgi:predicted permease
LRIVNRNLTGLKSPSLWAHSFFFIHACIYIYVIVFFTYRPSSVGSFQSNCPYILQVGLIYVVLIAVVLQRLPISFSQVLMHDLNQLASMYSSSEVALHLYISNFLCKLSNHPVS